MATKWAKKMVAIKEIHPTIDETKRKKRAKGSRLVKLKRKRNRLLLISGKCSPIGEIKFDNSDGSQKITVVIKPGADINYDPHTKVLKASISLDKTAKKT